MNISQRWNMVMDLCSTIDNRSQYPQILILTAVARSAKEIAECFQSLGHSVALTVHEDQNRWPKRRQITTPVIVGTQATTRDYIKNYKCLDLSAIKKVIIDEAELIEERGFTDQTIRIARELSDGCEVVLFSESDDHADQQRVQDFTEKLRSLPNIHVTTSQ
ncbi:ATP-dependent RNA helicase DDX25-like [Ptychodera flava]|uniref:ATP-dependent RNA helicase DDX25-like n=1 Tax=Ptychodera flava TaxID=63121 RepID=UPI003969E603